LKGPVFVVMCFKNYILSGGRDGMVHCWVCNKNMDNVGELQVKFYNTSYHHEQCRLCCI